MLAVLRTNRSGLTTENAAAPQTGKRTDPDPYVSAPPAKKKPNADLAQTDASGKFTANRRGNGLCADFQTGACQTTTKGVCPKNPALRHQCSICLSPLHGASSCTATSPAAAPSSGKGKGKKGKGRGKGKWNRAQY